MMVKDDEVVIVICNPKVAEELSLPSDTVVVTGILQDDEVIMCPKHDFVEWLGKKESL